MGDGLATGTRYGDSRFVQAPKFGFGSDVRPMVGTSKTYMGAELAKQNDNIIGGLSPGPCYAIKNGPRSGFPGHEPQRYTFGMKRVILGEAARSPGPGNVPFNALGKQRINSDFASRPAYGMGTSTRENMDAVDLSKYHVANLSSRALLGGPIDTTRAEETFRARAAANSPPQPSRAGLARALAVAMQAGADNSDPKLKAALDKLHTRVAVLAETKL